MSVIVKGMDVPSDCDGCWHPTCNLWIQTDVGKRHKDCPISPMPEKHGRLIDADELEDIFYSVYHSQSAGYVKDMETIVEAEGE